MALLFFLVLFFYPIFFNMLNNFCFSRNYFFFLFQQKNPHFGKRMTCSYWQHFLAIMFWKVVCYTSVHQVSLLIKRNLYKGEGWRTHLCCTCTDNLNMFQCDTFIIFLSISAILKIMKPFPYKYALVFLRRSKTALNSVA